MDEKKEQNIKAIIWDNAGVLGEAKCGSFGRLWVRLLGAPRQEVIRVLNGHEHDLFDMGLTGKDEFFDYVIKELDLPEEKKEALNSVCMDDMVCDEVLLDYIRYLHKSYITAILSNFPTYLMEMERTALSCLDEIFDHQIFSCEVHLLKPDPEIYQLALNRIGCKAEEAVFIDDVETNVAGAEKLGIHGILYKGRVQTIEALEAILD